MKFNVGETVVCIDDSPRSPGITPSLIKGNKYTIYEIRTCKCGFVVLDVGLTSYGRPPICYRCNNIGKETDIHWCN